MEGSYDPVSGKAPVGTPYSTLKAEPPVVLDTVGLEVLEIEEAEELVVLEVALVVEVLLLR